MTDHPRAEPEEPRADETDRKPRRTRNPTLRRNHGHHRRVDRRAQVNLVLELSERIKALEEAFGVSATAVAAAAPAGAARRDGGGEAAEEQTASTCS